MARLVKRDPERLSARLLRWRDAWWHATMRALLTRQSEPHRPRLGTSVLGRPRRSWDEPFQLTVNLALERAGLHPSDWQTLAQDRDLWRATELSFVSSRVRRVVVSPLPLGRLLSEFSSPQN